MQTIQSLCYHRETNCGGNILIRSEINRKGVFSALKRLRALCLKIRVRRVWRHSDPEGGGNALRASFCPPPKRSFRWRNNFLFGRRSLQSGPISFQPEKKVAESENRRCTPGLTPALHMETFKTETAWITWHRQSLSATALNCSGKRTRTTPE